MVLEYKSDEPTEEEKFEIAKEYANLSEEEKGEQMHRRYEELMKHTDMSSQSAQSVVQKEAQEMEKLIDKYGLRPEESDDEDVRTIWKGEKVKDAEEMEDEDEDEEDIDEELPEETEDGYKKNREGIVRG